MGLGQVAEHLPDVHQEGVAAALGDTQQHVELGQGDDDGRRVHEAEDDRVGDEVDDGPQFQDPQAELDEAHQEGQDQSQADEFLGEGHGEGGDGRRRHQGDDGDRSGGQLP